MAAKPETQFRKRVRDFLKKLPNTAFFPIQQVTIRGDPDFFLCVYGQFVALELKSKEGDTTPLQEFKLGEVKRAGGYALVASPKNWGDVKESLQKLATGEELFL
jgi:hypothetical protein